MMEILKNKKTFALLISLVFNIGFLTIIAIYLFSSTGHVDSRISGTFMRGVNPHIDNYIMRVDGNSFERYHHGEILDRGRYGTTSISEGDTPNGWFPYATPLLHEFTNESSETAWGFYTNNGFIIMFDETVSFGNIWFYRRVE